MRGLARLCKMYGRINLNGKIYLWDYVNDRPRLESEMTKQEITANNKFKQSNQKAR